MHAVMCNLSLSCLLNHFIPCHREDTQWAEVGATLDELPVHRRAQFENLLIWYFAEGCDSALKVF